MKSIVLCGLGILALAMRAIPGEAQAPVSEAEAVVSASKQATGGIAWDSLQGCYEEGTHGGGDVAYKTWFSLGRYGMRVESRRGDTVRSTGFNGQVSWRTNDAGGVDLGTDEGALREAVTTAYVSSNGFFFPERFPASFSYVRQAEHGGRTFDVLEITPVGGRALEYWFDRGTRFLGRVVDNQGPQAITVEAGDYRRVGDVTVAFSLTVLGPGGNVLDRGVLTSLRCGPVDAALFDPPRAP